MPVARRPLLRPGDGIDSQEFVEPVQLLQRIMIKLRLLPISQPINGRFDSALEKAVKIFQMENNLQMTGIVGLKPGRHRSQVRHYPLALPHPLSFSGPLSFSPTGATLSGSPTGRWYPAS